MASSAGSFFGAACCDSRYWLTASTNLAVVASWVDGACCGTAMATGCDGLDPPHAATSSPAAATTGTTRAVRRIGVMWFLPVDFTGMQPRSPGNTRANRARVDRGFCPRGAGRLRRDHRPAAGRVEDPLLEPRVAALHHPLGGGVAVVVVVGPQIVEQPVDPPAGLRAEEIGQFEGRLRLAGILVGQRPGVHAGGGDGEQFAADVDDAAEEGLLLLQRALPARHRVEGRPGQLAARPLGEAQVAGQRTEFVEAARLLAGAHGQGREP